MINWSDRRTKMLDRANADAGLYQKTFLGFSKAGFIQSKFGQSGCCKSIP